MDPELPRPLLELRANLVAEAERTALDRLAPYLGTDVGLMAGMGQGACEVQLLTERGEQAFRRLPSSVRRRFAGVLPFHLGAGMRCPVCDGGRVQGAHEVPAGRSGSRDYFCADCGWSFREARPVAARAAARLPRETVPAPASAGSDATRPVFRLQRRVRLRITDTMGFWNDDLGTHMFDPDDSATKDWWFRLPGGWLEHGALPAEKLESIYAYIYGPTWRTGYDDGGRYVILSTDVHVLDGDEEALRPWLSHKGKLHEMAEDGAVREVPPDEF
jgi:hypothetical protein